MTIYDVIILALIGIDILSLSMVAFIFRWARGALANFKQQMISLLSGDDPDSGDIIDKLGHILYQKLYRYFNLQKSNETANISLSDVNFEPENTSSTGSIPLAAAAKSLGIDDPGFLKYLPLIQKFMQSNKNTNTGSSISSADDSW